MSAPGRNAGAALYAQVCNDPNQTGLVAPATSPSAPKSLSERGLWLSIRLSHVAVEEIECQLDGLRRHFGIVSVHDILTVQTLLCEVAPNVPAMSCVLVNQELNGSTPVLLLLKPRDAVLRRCFSVESAHLH